MASMKAHAPKGESQPAQSNGGGGDGAIRAHTAAGLVLPAQLKNSIDGLVQAAQAVQRHTQAGKAAGLIGSTLELHEEAAGKWALIEATLKDAMEAVEKAVVAQEAALRDLFASADSTAGHLSGYPTTVGGLREGGQ